MTAPKIVTQTTSCGTCPHYAYYSGGTYQCALVEERVLNKEVIAPFCPLPDYPSHMIAKMEVTIDSLREPNKYGFNIALLSHVATKLRQPLEASRRSVAIPLKEGVTITLDPEWITKISVFPFEIMFRHGKSLYKLLPDLEKPTLHSQSHDDPSLWRHRELA